MDRLDRDERRFTALRETLRLYATLAQERDEAGSDESRDESNRKAESFAKVAQAVLGMEREDPVASGV